jgi:capsular exopolysaccharide synthesis family protein
MPRGRLMAVPDATPGRAARGSNVGDDPSAWARFLKAQALLILAVTVAAAAGAFAVSRLQPRVYTSQAVVVVFPASAFVSASQQAVVMGTEKGIASSEAVLVLASKHLNVPESTIAGGLAVTVPADTDLLDIGFSDRDPRVAQSAAEAVAAAYVAYRTPAPTPPPAKGAPAAPAVPGAVQPRIITDAALPAAPTSPNRTVDLVVALIVGIALGTGVAFARDALDDRLRGAADLEAIAGAPVLAAVPAVRVPAKDPQRRLVVFEAPRTTAAAAYRDLRTRVIQAGRDEAHTVLVTGCAGEDSTAVAANLATGIALTGRPVVLLCADLAGGRTHELFGVDNQIGLTSRLSGETNLKRALRATGIGGLSLVSAGPPVADPAAALQSPDLARVLATLRGQAAYVVISAPSLLASPDAGLLAEHADSVLLVAEAGRTKRAQVRGALQQLDAARDRVIGCALDGAGRSVRLKQRPLARASASLPAADERPGEPAATADRVATEPVERSDDEEERVPVGEAGLAAGPQGEDA